MTDLRSWLLPGLLVTAAIALAVSLLAMPGGDVYVAVMAAGVAVVVVMGMVPLPLLVFGWAALLPIWSIDPLPPVAFDALRLIGAGVIFLRMQRAPSVAWRQAVNSWVVPILAVGALMTTVAAVNADGRGWTTGTTMLIAAAVAYLVVVRVDRPGLVFGGYLAGVALSASVLIMSAFGYTALSPQDNPGFDRLTGLAPSATLAASDFALAVVIGWAYLSTRSRWQTPALLGMGVALVALLLSGGRVGVAGVAVATGCALLAGWVRPKHVVIGVSGLAGLLWVAPHIGLQFFTLDRLLGTSDTLTRTSFSSGRFEVLPEAARAVVLDPLGHGLDGFVAAHGAIPHTPILYLGLGGGLAAALIALALTVRVLRRVLRPLRDSIAPQRAAHLVLAVFVATIALEPSGPFVGVATLTLLFLSAGLLPGKQPRRQAPVLGRSIEA
ncbi:MAG TPA: hypothetical protein VK053_19330 [Jiangellaceae bacterium]|nr:hypothetical protein [Jiangellaceae bacterium]